MQPLHKSELELILLQERGLINELLKRLRSKKQDVQFDEVHTLMRYRYKFFYDDIILEKLDAISQNLNGQNLQCRYSKDSDRLLEMLVLPPLGESNINKARSIGLREIRDFTFDAKELIVIDPYIYGGPTEGSQKYIDEFKKASRIDGKSLKKIHVIFSSKHGNTSDIRMGIKKLVSDNKCSISEIDTDRIHDRIWIKNSTEAILVGNSFGGIGEKLCFVLKLPETDLYNLLTYLSENACLTKK